MEASAPRCSLAGHVPVLSDLMAVKETSDDLRTLWVVHAC
jgi:hypothetical protein